MRPTALVFAAALFAPLAAHADPCRAPLPRPGTVFIGVVRYVGDGDSLCVETGRAPGDWIEVRIADFYAPELHDAGGASAKAVLERLALGKRVRCVAGRRSYDRVVAVCTLKGRSLAALLRRAGVQEGGRGWATSRRPG